MPLCIVDVARDVRSPRALLGTVAGALHLKQEALSLQWQYITCISLFWMGNVDCLPVDRNPGRGGRLDRILARPFNASSMRSVGDLQKKVTVAFSELQSKTHPARSALC